MEDNQTPIDFNNSFTNDLLKEQEVQQKKIRKKKFKAIKEKLKNVKIKPKSNTNYSIKKKSK